MNGVGGWLGSGAAIIVIGICVIVMMHLHRLPRLSHPWIGRGVIFAMYGAGAALVVTPVGQFLLGLERRVTGLFGGTASGLGWAGITIATLFLAAAIVVALIWEPDPGFAYVAAAAPLIMALAASGFARQVYTATTAPAQQAVAAIATWAGG